MAKYSGRLDLPRITSLDARTAAALAAHRGSLCLPGISEVTEEVAIILADYPGTLTLGALQTIPPALVRHYGQKGTLPDLQRVENLSAESAAELAKHTGPLFLPAMTSLPLDTAKALATHTNSLTLPALNSVTPELAEVLSSCRGALSLPGLRDLTLQSAEAFSRQYGLLELAGVRHISVDSARILAKHNGPVVLTGLIDMDNETEDALRTNPLCRIPFNARRWLRLIGISALAILAFLAISYFSAPRDYRAAVISTGRPNWWIYACGLGCLCKVCWRLLRALICWPFAYCASLLFRTRRPN